MRKDIVVLIGILAVIGAVGVAVSVNVVGVPHTALTGSRRGDGLLRVLLVAAAGAFAVSQALISHRVLRLVRNRVPGHDARGEPGNPAIEVIWTVIPTALVIGVGLYALLRP